MWKALNRDIRGASLVEFGLAMPLMLVVLTGLVNVTDRLSATREVQVANNAGIRYAARSGFDKTKITQLVEGASKRYTIKASPAPLQTCGCVGGEGSFISVGCGDKCLGQDPGNYVVVNASVQYSDPFPWFKVNDDRSIDITTWTRIR